SALGLRPAEHDLGPAVPLREGEAQHPRRHRGAAVQIAAAQREAAAEPAAVRQSGGVTAVQRRFSWHAGGLAALGLATILYSPLHAQDAVESFYQGRQINLVVGYGPGGGYDLTARLLARHIGRFIPGRPSVAVQNMPGAGSLRAANWLAEAAPKDGGTIGLIGSDIAMIALLG